MNVSVGDIHKHRITLPRANEAIPIKLESNDSPVISRNHLKSLLFTLSKYLNMNDKKKPNNKPMVRKEETLAMHSLTTIPALCPFALKKALTKAVARPSKKSRSARIQDSGRT